MGFLQKGAGPLFFVLLWSNCLSSLFPCEAGARGVAIAAHSHAVVNEHPFFEKRAVVKDEEWGTVGTAAHVWNRVD